MIGIILSTKINLRSEMRVALETDVGDLFAGDVVVGTLLGNWMSVSDIYRKTAGVAARETMTHPRYAAAIEPSNPTIKHMMLVDAASPAPVPEPTPEPVAKAFRVEIGGDDYKSVVVDVEPK